jgi:hypothetical protein
MFKGIKEKLQSVLGKQETAAMAATNDDKWGPTGHQMDQVIVEFREDREQVMADILERLRERGENWRRCYKALLLLDHMARNGPKGDVMYLREFLAEIQSISQDFEFKENNVDHGLSVRERAKKLYMVLTDDALLKEERDKAEKTRNNISSVGSTGHGHGSRHQHSNNSHGNGESSHHSNSSSTYHSRHSAPTRSSGAPAASHPPQHYPTSTSPASASSSHSSATPQFKASPTPATTSNAPKPTADPFAFLDSGKPKSQPASPEWGSEWHSAPSTSNTTTVTQKPSGQGQGQGTEDDFDSFLSSRVSQHEAKLADTSFFQ